MRDKDTAMADSLYGTDSIEFRPGDDPAAFLRHCSAQAYIESVVATASRVLAEAGHDPRRPASLLCADTLHDEPLHLAARALELVRRLLNEIDRGGDIMAVIRHAIQLGATVERAKHLEAWGESVLEKNRRDVGGKRGARERSARQEQVHQAVRDAARRECPNLLAKSKSAAAAWLCTHGKNRRLSQERLRKVLTCCE